MCPCNHDPTRERDGQQQAHDHAISFAGRARTWLTNAFSKKVENLEHAVALHFVHYNFCRPHKTLSNPYPTTPAMAAGIADHVFTIGAIVSLIEAREQPQSN